jgi:hypothetical protein
MKAPYASSISNDVTLNAYRIRIQALYDLLNLNPVDTLNTSPGNHSSLPAPTIPIINSNTLVGMNGAKKDEAIKLLYKLSNLIEEAIDLNQS